jgi:hypothetical protein
MSGIEIRSGGTVEVDSASLRDAAARLRGIAEDARDEADGLRRLSDRVLALPGAGAASGAGSAALSLAWASRLLAQAADRAGELGDRVAHAAGIYEAVELLIARDLARAAGDELAAADAERRFAALWAAQPAAATEALGVISRPRGPSDLEWQTWLASSALGMSGLGVFSTVLWAAQAAIGLAGRGVVPADARLRGAIPPVAVSPVRSGPAAPPASLAEAAARIPGGGDTRVRVERYAMPGGGVQFAVYIAGTQSGGPREAFDMASNLELYNGRASASYDAVRQALRAAGAGPGATVHVFGHSQGAMLGERLALEGEYVTPTVVSFGSPVQADLGPGTLAVSVRHTDDPVAALQHGGLPGVAGAPGSFVVERQADPAAGLHDATMPAHHMTAYAETAARVDASADPRVGGLRHVFGELARAEAVTATEYAAGRVSPRDEGAG